ncbi:guanylate-binding protein 7-like isoform X3 [Dipodomys merriami]|uniref:guanylate-binding protein 7-like isoform X3 n=1 Tax=Dipodomys merriami TaxID=94247 RepID=UPI00385567DB
MASESTVMAPICLVENEKEHLMVNPEAIKVLEAITHPVVVVAIVGMYRTGKSYLMNRLAGHNQGFQLGSTVRSQTKGIWMWCVTHPTKPNFTLVLLDTEGLGDVEKDDPKNDSWIFALSILLSSTFVYNSMGTINQQALEQLHYVTELTELIRAKSAKKSDEMDDSDEFVSFFPDFVWAVRDFILELKLDDQPITEDEYLENALKLIPGKNQKIRNANLPRECIRHFFPKRKCFVFDRPTKEKELLIHIEDLPEDQLDCNFQVQSKNFCSYIFANSKPKNLREGIIVTGKRLGTLVETYVSAINSGAVPCLENAVTTLAQLENSAAVQKAADHYSQHMAQQLRLPTEDLQELLDVHATCEREAIAVFMELSFKDDKREFQNDLMANEVLQIFLQSQDAIEKSILQSDKALTDGEKARAGTGQAERAAKEAAEKEQELLRQEQKKQQQKMEAQEKSYKENMAQLKEKMERERKNVIRDQEKKLEHKLKIQEEMLKEGFKNKCEAIGTEIHQLKKEIETSKTDTLLDGVLGDVLLLAAPDPFLKLAGAFLKVVNYKKK